MKNLLEITSTSSSYINQFIFARNVNKYSASSGLGELYGIDGLLSDKQSTTKSILTNAFYEKNAFGLRDISV